MSKAKRSTQRFPVAPPPMEPGAKSNLESDTVNQGTIEHHDKEGRDLSMWGKDDGRRLVKKGK